MYNIVSMLYEYYFFKRKTEYEIRISDWSSDVCSSDLLADLADCRRRQCHPARACGAGRGGQGGFRGNRQSACGGGESADRRGSGDPDEQPGAIRRRAAPATAAGEKAGAVQRRSERGAARQLPRVRLRQGSPADEIGRAQV